MFKEAHLTESIYSFKCHCFWKPSSVRD